MNNKKDVLITIHDEQLSDGESEKLELTTTGTLTCSDAGVRVEYDELEGELSGSVTSLLIDSPTCVTMQRGGAYNSQLIIEQNKRHSCYYDTPYGSFMMGVFARRVHASVTESGGTLDMEYTVDFNSGLAAENIMHITVTEL